MKPLYEIANEYQAMLDDNVTEDGEIKDLALFEKGVGAFDSKAIAIASFIKNLEANINAIKDAEEAMKKRRHSLESLLKDRENYLMFNMQRCEISEISCPYFAISLKENRESVDDYDKGAIPKKFIRTKVEESVDKKAVYAAIKAGEDVPGARLIRKSKLEIK